MSEENKMAKVNIDIVDFEYTYEVIRNRYPSLVMTHIKDTQFCSMQIEVQGPLEDLTRFMAVEYCDGMHPEDAKFYMGLIQK
ncbi:hypothetical protein [Escherichia phage IME08]|uniref:Uncharacterized 8.8 kDa protein in frd-Gp32 intergenic region n=1 Tax=Escherichia phage IME08 TaxID=698728 RepID=D7RMN7_9CAUD|nr:hypothetical protein IME08_gp223 [Escherichia phage IME08]ADI55553.1 hypothetical protein [Escherichia phage IME08]